MEGPTVCDLALYVLQCVPDLCQSHEQSARVRCVFETKGTPTILFAISRKQHSTEMITQPTQCHALSTRGPLDAIQNSSLLASAFGLSTVSYLPTKIGFLPAVGAQMVQIECPSPATIVSFPHLVEVK